MATAALFLLPLLTQAQTVYPVLVQQVPPTSLGRLTDLTDAAAQSWSVTLVLQDTREPSLPVALRVRLTGNAFSAVTLDPMRAPLVTLNPGVPTVLTVADLAPYLAPGNLSVRGRDAAAFFAGGAVLPEGVYELCVEVVPVGRAGSVSVGGNGCTMALAQSYAPPQITAPLDGSGVLVTDPQNLQLAWQHVGPAPPGALYTLEVWAVPDDFSLSTQDLIDFQGPLFRSQARPELTFLYSNAEPELLAGRGYVARVLVEDPSGMAAIANQGYSRPIRFTYGQGIVNGCLAPVSATLETVGQTEAVLSWVPPAPQDETYIGVRVEVADAATGQGFGYTLNGETSHHIRQLSQAREYRYSVQGVCLDGRRSAGRGGTFTTQPSVQDNPRVADCGSLTEATAENLDGTTIGVGQTLTYEGFAVEVKEGTAGASFTGRGTFIIPWLEQGLLSVELDGITVDASGEINGGTISPVRNQDVPAFDPAAYSAEFGDESCNGQYAGQQVDANGFYPDGVHYVTGGPLDPRGFGPDGTFRGPGATEPYGPVDDRGFNQEGLFVDDDGGTSPYDSTGCDLDGYTAQGLPCGTSLTNLDQIMDEANDYYAGGLGDGGLVDVLADEGIEQLPPEVQGVANAVKQLATDGNLDIDNLLRLAVRAAYEQISGQEVPALVDQALDAGLDQLRTPPGTEALVNGFDAPRELLLGEEDELLKEGGPRRLFPDGLPEQLPTDGRDADVVAYENLVISLYNKDESLYLTRGKEAVLELWDDFAGEQYLLDLAYASVAKLDASGDLDVDGITALVTDPTALGNLLLDVIREDLETKARAFLEGQTGDDDGSGGDDDDDGWGDLEWHIPAREWFSRPDPEQLWGSTQRYSVAPDPEGERGFARNLLPPPSRHPLLGFELPLKLEKRAPDGKTYTLVIEDVNVPLGQPDVDVTVSAYGILPVEGKPGEAMVFEARDLPIGFNGFEGDGRLSLVSAVSFGLGSVGTFAAPAAADRASDASIYIEFDCDGFAGFRFAGDLLFCRDVVAPYDEDLGAVVAEGTLSDDGKAADRVRARVEIEGSDWPQFTVQVTQAPEDATAFVANGNEQVIWTLQDFVLDYDETATPTLDLPADYQLAGTMEQWRGVYVEQIEAYLPEAYECEPDPANGNSTAVTIDAHRLMIDGTGVSVEVEATNPLPLSAGTFDTWAVSIDEARLTLLQNQLRLFSLEGQMRLPVDGDEPTPFSYTGGYTHEAGFAFSAQLQGPMNFAPLGGSLTIYPGSLVTAKKYEDTGYRAVALIDGELSVGLSAGALSFDGIVFDDLKVATTSPYLSVDGSVSARAGMEELKLGAFTVSLDEFGYHTRGPAPGGEDWFGLRLGGQLSLMGGSGGFGIGGKLDVYGSSTEGPGGARTFAYEDYFVDDVTLAVEIPGVDINGTLKYEKGNRIYGNGYYGALRASIDGIPYAFSASGSFGSIAPATEEDVAAAVARGEGDADAYVGPGYRYWGVDVVALFDTPIAILPSFGMSAAGGGVSYHMKRDDEPGQPLNINFREPASERNFGESVSGITYVPDYDVRLGARIMLGLATLPKKETFNADLALGLEFSESNGINRIDLNGSGRFVTPPPADPSQAPGDAKLRADVALSVVKADGYSLVGNMRGYMNFGSVVGAHTYRGEPNYLGQISLRMAPDDWYVWLGEPATPLSATFKDFGVTAGTYLNVGSTIPAYPGLKPRYDELNLRMDVRNARSGFQHGTEISVRDTLEPWIFKASIDAEIGYNVLLTDSNTGCPPGSGLNGWRIAGAAYFGLLGRLDVSAPGWACPSCPKEVNVGSIDVIAAATVEGVNPTYAQAAARINASLFDGWWEPSWSGRVSFGERCDPSAPPPEIWQGSYPKDIIVEVGPQDDAENVSPTARPYVRTLLPVNEPLWVGRFEPGGERMEQRPDHKIKQVVKIRLLWGNTNVGPPGFIEGIPDADDPTLVRWDPGAVTSLANDRPYRLVVESTLVKLEADGTTMQGNPVYREGRHTYRQSLQRDFRTAPGQVPAVVQTTVPEAGDTLVSTLTALGIEFDHERTVEGGTFTDTRAFRPVVQRMTLSIYDPSAGESERRTVEDWRPNTGLTRLPGEANAIPAQLLGDTTYYAYAQVAFVDANGNTLKKAGTGVTLYELHRWSFRTGPRPTRLLPENVAGAWPLPDQYNYYLDQEVFPEGRMAVTTVRGQVDLFAGTTQFPEGVAAPGEELVVVYRDNYTGDVVAEDPVEIVSAAAAGGSPRPLTVFWRKPTQLQPGGAYRYEIVRRALPDAQAVATANGGGSEASSPAGAVLYAQSFRVSHYPTINQKLQALTAGPLARAPLEGVVAYDYPADDFTYPRWGTMGQATCSPEDVAVAQGDDVRWVPAERHHNTTPRPLGDLLVKGGGASSEPFGTYELSRVSRRVLGGGASGAYATTTTGPFLQTGAGRDLPLVASLDDMLRADTVTMAPLGFFQAGGPRSLTANPASDPDVGTWYAPRPDGNSGGSSGGNSGGNGGGRANGPFVRLSGGGLSNYPFSIPLAPPDPDPQQAIDDWVVDIHSRTGTFTVLLGFPTLTLTTDSAAVPALGFVYAGEINRALTYVDEAVADGRGDDLLGYGGNRAAVDATALPNYKEIAVARTYVQGLSPSARTREVKPPCPRGMSVAECSAYRLNNIESVYERYRCVADYAPRLAPGTAALLDTDLLDTPTGVVTLQYAVQPAAGTVLPQFTTDLRFD